MDTQPDAGVSPHRPAGAVAVSSAGWARRTDISLASLERDSARLVALERLEPTEAPRDEAFDRVTRLAKKLFHVPIAIVSLNAMPLQWDEWTMEESHGVARGGRDGDDRDDRPVVVVDAAKDRRFARNPFVGRKPGVRFYAGVPLRISDGRVVGSLCLLDTTPHQFDTVDAEIMCDLARLVVEELELRLCAIKDGLTGALSRRSFEEEARRAIALAQRHGHDLTCVAFDLDHFKRINDTFGHAAGDVVLAKTIHACTDQLRTTDFIGRMGGEEFAVLLPHTGPVGALEVADRLRTCIERLPIALPSRTVRVTASFGVAALDPSIETVEALLIRADEALYEAKVDGRNRCAEWRQTGPAALPKRQAPRTSIA